MSTHNGLAMHITFISFYISIIFTVHIVYHYQLLAGRNWKCSYMFSCYSQSFKFFVHRHHAWISSQNSCQLIKISCRQCLHVCGEKDSLVIVMVWLGLESWSTRLSCSLGVITCGVSLGSVRLC